MVNLAAATPTWGGKGFGDPIGEWSDSLSDFMTELRSSHEAMLGFDKKYYQLRANEAKKSNLAAMRHELKCKTTTAERKKQLEVEIQEEIQNIERRAAQQTARYVELLYEHTSRRRLASVADEQAKRIESERAVRKEEYLTKLACTTNSAEIAELNARYHQQEVDAIRAQVAANDKAAKAERENRQSASKMVSAYKKTVQDAADADSESKSKKFVVGAKNLVAGLASVSLKDMAKIYRENEKQAKDRLDKARELEEQAKESGDEGAIKKAEESRKAAEADFNNERFKAEMAELASTVTGAISASMDKAFNDAENILTNYGAVINARLQGSDKNFKDISNTITSNLSVNPFIKSAKVMEELKNAVDKGINYNVEQRAFLQTVSDKIADTFDAFDSNLLRLIRLQQADTTAARLGMEAELTKMFNSMFQDTSYLSDVADSVSAAIIDANASMNRNQSAEFEFIVQKWLGSLGSLGMSSNTLTQIAEGINYLATGDVTSLSSNTQLQTLMAMSASAAGLSYSDMLIKGLDASSTNKLLEGMLTYLKEIAEKSDNQVVRSAYGDVFNLSMSDMKAISNLSSGDISAISGKTMAYNSMVSEVQNQFNQMWSRHSMGEIVSNLYDNAMYGMATDRVNNPVLYATHKMLKFMENNQIDINIPFVNAMGFGLDLNATVTDLMKMGLGIASAFSLIGNVVQGLGSGGGMNLNSWNATEYTQRGTNMSFTTGGVQGGTSSSTYIANSNTSDIKNSTLSSATDDAEETKEITNKNSDPGHTVDDIYKAVIEGSENNNWVRVQEKLLGQVYMSTSEWLHTQDVRMVFDQESLKVIDTRQSYLDKGQLRVNDESMQAQLFSLFGAVPLVTEAGTVKVTETSAQTLIAKVMESPVVALTQYSEEGRIKVSDSGMDNIVSSIAALSATMSALSPTVKIDKNVIMQAIKEALLLEDDGNTLQSMIDKIVDEELTVTIPPSSAMPVTVEGISPAASLSLITL